MPGNWRAKIEETVAVALDDSYRILWPLNPSATGELIERVTVQKLVSFEVPTFDVTRTNELLGHVNSRSIGRADAETLLVVEILPRPECEPSHIVWVLYRNVPWTQYVDRRGYRRCLVDDAGSPTHHAIDFDETFGRLTTPDPAR